MTELSTMTIDTPIGVIRIDANADALVALHLPEGGDPRTPAVARRTPFLDHAARELTEYFAGTRRDFTIPLEPHGTEFQLRVWLKLQDIPFGTTWSYGALARAIGQPTASRAVGAANGHNPLAIIVPCHRVIGTSGELTGYGGGMAAKRWLLEHEGVLPTQQALALS